METTSLIFEGDDQVANGAKCGVDISISANIVEFVAVAGNGNALQPTAPSTIVVVDEFSLKSLPRLPGAFAITVEREDVEFADLFTPVKEGVKCKGNDLRLTAERSYHGRFGVISHNLIRSIIMTGILIIAYLNAL